MKGFILLKTVLFTLILFQYQSVLAQDKEPDSGIPVEAEQVHINQADTETIAQVLDGVGMSRARAIVEWRQEFGAFESLDDLMLVDGIGEQTVQRNQHKIVFD